MSDNRLSGFADLSAQLLPEITPDFVQQALGTGGVQDFVGWATETLVRDNACAWLSLPVCHCGCAAVRSTALLLVSPVACRPCRTPWPTTWKGTVLTEP